METVDLFRFQRHWSVFGVVFFYPLSAICREFVMHQYSVGLCGPPRPFTNPWTINIFMAIAMSCGFLVDLFIEKIDPQLKVPVSVIPINIKLLIPVSAMLDSICCWCLNLCIFYLGVSVSLLLRIFDLTFISVLYLFVFKREIYGFEWFSIVIINFGIVLVTISDIKSTDVGPEDINSAWPFIVLLIFTQFAYAIRDLIENYILHHSEISPNKLCGAEGCIQILVVLFMALPVSNFLPNMIGGGFKESLCDSFLMIMNSRPLLFSLLVYTFVSIWSNVAIMHIISNTSCVYYSVLGVFAAAITWMIKVLIGLIGANFPYLHPLVVLLGEKWETIKWLKLIGFLCSLSGVAFYTKTIKLFCFFYPESPFYEIPLPLDIKDTSMI